MIVTQKVEDAVDDQPRDFAMEAVTTFPGLPAGRRNRNHDVPQKTRNASFHIAGIRQRKCQHVGGLIFASVNPVERLNPAVA